MSIINAAQIWHTNYRPKFESSKESVLFQKNNILSGNVDKSVKCLSLVNHIALWLTEVPKNIMKHTDEIL